jgi:adenylate kinase family enzyme
MPGLSDKRRVLVIGCGGAGKSTFSRALARITGLPLIHLDRYYWSPGWRPMPEDAWNRRVAELIAPEAWIMDGNYANSLPARLARCDAVVFFDIGRRTCLWTALRRVVVHRFVPRPDLPEGCPESVDREFLRWIWNFPEQSRPRLVEALKTVRPEVLVAHITRRRQTRGVLDSARPRDGAGRSAPGDIRRPPPRGAL